MRQQVMTEPRKIVFRTVEAPSAEPGRVLLRVRRIGVCGSDIHVYHGTHPFTAYPVTQGHEVSAEVVALGEGVTGLTPGQRVTVEPQIVCGECYPCRHGKYNLCEKLKVMGFQDTGLASEYFLADPSRITQLPEGLSFDEGAMIEPLAVTVHAVRRFPDMDGANVAILGAGPIGQLLAQSCRAAGAKKIMITDISDLRLNIARNLGVDVAVNTRDIPFERAVLSAFGPDRADVIYDCAGNDQSMGDAIASARKGSTIILVAVFGKKANVDLAVLNDHELDLNTSMMYRHEDYVQAIDWVNEGKIQLKPLISRHFPFSEYLEAYR
ncbi:MAG: alcohol dehydrogenase catalytic domain-containing protein, partial [Clostridia bacterium]|nr:alcohol dehydrogenase catalytic domain-containing protein [Clostridia bacterium]